MVPFTVTRRRGTRPRTPARRVGRRVVARDIEGAPVLPAAAGEVAARRAGGRGAFPADHGVVRQRDRRPFRTFADQLGEPVGLRAYVPAVVQRDSAPIDATLTRRVRRRTRPARQPVHLCSPRHEPPNHHLAPRRSAPHRAVDHRQRRPAIGPRRSWPTPSLELVGCYAWAPDKVGRDVGELCGTEPLGVLATDDVDALLALAPDCVVYNPKWPDVDELVRILEAGVNVVTTAAFITGHALGDGPPAARSTRASAAAARIFGSGMNPGFADPARHRVARASATGSTRSRSSSRSTRPATTRPTPSCRSASRRPIDDPSCRR